MPSRTTQVWQIIQQWMDGQIVGVTQSKVAEAIGVQRSALSQWKYGQARPTPANLRRVHEVTRVPYRRLLDALLVDMGYLSTEEVVGNAQHPAPRTQAGNARTDDVSTQPEGRIPLGAYVTELETEAAYGDEPVNDLTPEGEDGSSPDHDSPKRE
jgi:transcriptional regulator with XRE-family HTH domain